MPVAILAGGLATRLRPLTETVPKGLLQVAGKPFLEHQFLNVREQGVSTVVLCLGFLGELISQRFAAGEAYGLTIHYSFDGPVLLGTGGAIRQALPLLGDAFFVMYGDSYLQIDFARVVDAFQKSGKRGLMTVFRNHNRWDVSNVHFVDGNICAYDKKCQTHDMCHIDYGLSVFSASVFEEYPMGTTLDLADVMSDLVTRGEMAGFEATERFYEIGSPDGLTELDRLLSQREC
jgi:NDP-sugar pyrophosphorylase family protein